MYSLKPAIPPQEKAERPVLKPTRSMTHPLRDPNGRTQKRRVPKQSGPLDAEDLSRRLNQHLDEQKARALKRREIQIQKEREAAGIYHHIPSVAADSFQRTATPDALGTYKVHKLAAPAVKLAFVEPKLEPGHAGPTTLLKINQMRDQMSVEREMIRNRNQFQWTHGMEEALVSELDRDLYRPPQRTFQHETSHVRITHSKRAARPLSTGDIFTEEEGEVEVRAKPVKLRGKAAAEVAKDRHDWAQRDDEVGQVKKQRSSIFLRKRDSTAKKERSGSDETIKEEGEGASGEVPATRKGFLARFKRHPS
ncbi:hypothetical protein GLAREA_07750 [Glarea lozoyensis ATCC 20868]|uniref:Uncharacterized protein n=1 Tax=Glarea lozoyensis (strain ATCC 20868 / MF5171) TaxID=1116229 RepID=S3DKN5_GLAL2|nr:uncharacterized protein GLAREA_07750 [Glarea lozoyensis ATCC 20868]EPE32616.1 hypothetical protein GLAREA_07750 [Glarea lozoyensis ATCC 20868]